MDAALARVAYFGVQGRLFPEMSQIKNLMAQSGPAGEAALARMNQMESAGWKFGPMGFNDPYLKAQAPGLLQRSVKFITLAGYNDLIHGKVAYNPFAGTIYTAFGMVGGADRDAVAKYIHEIGHGQYEKGWVSYESGVAAKKAFAELSPAARKAHGQAMLAEELRALTAHTAGNTHLNSGPLHSALPHLRGISNLAPELALSHDYAGAFVHKTWPYEGMKALTTAEAAASAREHLSTTIGYENGKITPAVEQRIAQQIEAVPLRVVHEGAALRQTQHDLHGLSRGGQRAGSLVLAAGGTHVIQSFAESAAAGTARLAGVTMNWAAFEVGVTGGTWSAIGLSKIAGKSCPRLAMLAMPLLAVGGGLGGAELERHWFGWSVEQTIKKWMQ